MILSHTDLKRLKHFYDESLEKYGVYDARSLQWSSLENQLGRFQALLQVASPAKINNCRILDVGCGLGDLYTFLIDQNLNVTYTGIDILPEFIHEARKKHDHLAKADSRPTFISSDIFSVEKIIPKASFDYVFSSGAMSFKVDNHKEYYFRIIEKMYSLANNALAFNMLDEADHIDDETYAAYSPFEVSEFCRTFCDNVQILTGYLDQDFTIFCFKK